MKRFHIKSYESGSDRFVTGNIINTPAEAIDTEYKFFAPKMKDSEEEAFVFHVMAELLARIKN